MKRLFALFLLLVAPAAMSANNYGILDSALYPTSFGTSGYCWTSNGNGVIPSWQVCANAGGSVTSVATGSGLTGGPITSTGTVNLANTTPTSHQWVDSVQSNVLHTSQPGIADLSGFGTGVATALGVNVGSAGAPVLFNGAGGTPSSLTLTNGTGLPVSTGLTGQAAGMATWWATPSSANLAAAVTDETGSGSLVFATSPTLVTPVLGAATATSINKMAVTAPATGSTFACADGKTCTISNTLTFTGTDSSSLNVQTGGTLAPIAATPGVGDIAYFLTGGATPTGGLLTAGAAGTFPMFNGATTAPIVSTLKLPNVATSGDFCVASATNTVGCAAKVAPTGVVVGDTDTQTLTNKTMTNPVINGATGTGLTATGIVAGQSPNLITTSTPITVSSTSSTNAYFVNQHATAGTAIEYDLPTPPAAGGSAQFCFGNGWNGSAANTGKLKIKAGTSTFIVFTDGTLSASAGFVQSPGAAADFGCVFSIDSTHWFFRPGSGTWTKDS